MPAWYPSQNHPVFGIFIREHAQAVSLYNNKVVVIYTALEEELKDFFSFSDSIEGGIRTIRVRHRLSPVPYTNFLLHFIGTWQAFRCLIKEGYRPDIIHAHVFSAGVPAVLLGRLYKIPVIITEHRGGFISRTLSKMDVFRAKYAMKRANLLLPVSNSLRTHIRQYGINVKSSVVPNVVNIKMFNIKKTNLEHEKKKLLTVALLYHPKGIPYLLQAIKKLYFKRQDYILDIVGDGPDRDELEAISIKEGINNIVTFHGIKNKKDVSQFMSEADIFILPSISENLPCVLIEAMASGLPIIATRVGGVPELILDDIGKLVSPKDPDALAEAIDYMLDHFQDYNAQKMRQYAQEKYSYEVVGLQLDQLYRQTIANHKMDKR